MTACGGSSAAKSTSSTSNSESSITLDTQNIYCPDRYYQQEISNSLVLKTSQTLYDSGEIQQIKDYVLQASVKDLSQDGIAHPETVPSALQWVSNPLVGKTGPGGCVIILHITYNGEQPILFHNITVKTIQSPVKNNSTYRLLDFCSLGATNLARCHPCSTCGTAPDSPRTTKCHMSILLNQNATTFTDTSTDNNNTTTSTNNNDEGDVCTDTTFNQGDSLLAYIHINSQQNYIYNIAASASFQLVNGSNKDFPLLKNTQIEFAQPQQLSCYRLTDNVFQEIPMSTPYAWCL
jgi:hypothetical protein